MEATLREARRDAKVLMLGLGPYLDGIHARADGPTLRVTMTLSEPQLRDLGDRLGGLLQLARGKLAR
jgi:hypothetical protein